jgi:beta-lactamase class D
MRKLISFLLFSSIVSIRAQAAEPDFARIFQGRDGCFVLYDLKTETVSSRFNEARCSSRVSPCSTFKVALAVMAFDNGALQDQNTTFKWDGVDRGSAYWNRDTSAADWIKYSVVWFSQRLTPQLGAESVQNYLAKFDYGNRDISGGLTNFWLGRTLKISADEEIRFLKKLWRDQLPASKRAMQLTRQIMSLETSRSGMKLAGKTGSHVTQKNALGWFVGHLEGQGGEYLVAVNYNEDNPQHANSYPGMIAEDMCKEILTELKLY